MYDFELAYDDAGLNDFFPFRETSKDSQLVVYEDHRAMWDHYSPITEEFLKKKTSIVPVIRLCGV